MHYTDKGQLENNILEIVIYTHSHLGTKKTDFQITSIQNCKYFSPRILNKMLNKTQKYFNKIDEFKNLKQEEYFLCTLKQIGWDDIQIVNIENVSNNENKLLQLH